VIDRYQHLHGCFMFILPWRMSHTQLVHNENSAYPIGCCGTGDRRVRVQAVHVCVRVDGFVLPLGSDSFQDEPSSTRKPVISAPLVVQLSSFKGLHGGCGSCLLFFKRKALGIAILVESVCVSQGPLFSNHRFRRRKGNRSPAHDPRKTCFSCCCRCCCCYWYPTPL